MTLSIAIDSDGVLCDFNSHVKSLCGKTPNEIGDEALWAIAESQPDFWHDIPYFDWAHDLVDLCRPYNAFILTGCPKTGYDRAAAHKKERLERDFGIPVVTCRSKDKALHMRAPGDILIDDMVPNVKRWDAAGGRSIRFKSFDQAREKLALLLESSSV